MRRAGEGFVKKTAALVLPFGVLVLIYIFLLIGCGIEDYPYLDPVDQGNISREFDSRAVITIGGKNSGNSSFYNYAIYYRIYVSNVIESSPSTGNFSTINPTLAQDYSAIAAYINSTTTGSTSMGTLFQDRNYNVLEHENGSFDNLLGGSQTVVMEFPQNQGVLPEAWPYITINGSGPPYYYLYRSTGNGRFNPMPLNNRYFMNSADLTNPVYINQNNNADVVNKDGTPRYAYAAFFIVAVGFDTTTFSSIYSNPAFVGVLRLPDISP
jgi:hypothetical protein